MGFKFNPIDLRLKVYNRDKLYNEISDDDYKEEDFIVISDIPPQAGYEEEANEGKGFKILTKNKLLIRFSTFYSINKSWKQSIQLKKWNQTNITSFVSAQ